jgi:hypothetical protein
MLEDRHWEICRWQCSIPFTKYVPVLPKFIDHIHMVNRNPVPVDTRLQTVISRNFRELLRLHRRGVIIVFPDILRLEQLMIVELAEQGGE